LARPVPGGSHLSVALFDAGPGQLGSPRIAQLAALIVLARRAEAAGVRFGWGILQEPDEPLLTAVTPASVLRLLQSRTPHEATDAQIEAWHERLDGWRERDDAWIVGARRLGGLPMGRSASHLQVWDVLDPRVRRVGVTVIRGSLPPREIALDLPEEDACVRLLRDPFNAAAPPPRSLAEDLAPVSNLLFTGTGSRLLARTASGAILAVFVPNSPRMIPPEPRAYVPSPGERVTAAGFAGRSAVLVTARDGLVNLYKGARDRRTVLDSVYNPYGHPPFQPGEGMRLWPCVRIRSRTLAVDGKDTLFDLSADQSFLVASVVALAVYSENLALVGSLSSGEHPVLALVTGEWGSAPVRRDSLEDLDAREAFFGYGGSIADRWTGLAAVRQDERRWRIFHQGGPTGLAFAEGVRAVGVARRPRGSAPGLLLLDDDRRTLVLAGTSWSLRLPAASSEIVEAAASHRAPVVAYTTAAGELVLYSLDQERVLTRLVPGGPA
ncbi:MAG TPA: hypothetical protein VLT87_08100, partial [Thermoanaerobaculia bacterium]|nr:hypothetical protein [Thermoanaerobaculia bacterium]